MKPKRQRGCGMSRARDWDWRCGRFVGGFTFYPYQIALGMTIRYWPCIFAPSIRIHIGPFKIWVAILSGEDHNVS